MNNEPYILRRPKVEDKWVLDFSVSEDEVRLAYEQYQREINDNSYSIGRSLERILACLRILGTDMDTFLSCQILYFDSNGGTRKSINPKSLYSSESIRRYKKYVLEVLLPSYCYKLRTKSIPQFAQYLSEEHSEEDIKLFFAFVVRDKFYSIINPWCASLVAEDITISDPYLVPLKILYEEGMRVGRIHGLKFIKALIKTREIAISTIKDKRVLEYL